MCGPKLKTWLQDWPGWKKMAAASGRGSQRNSGRKKTISDLKQCKREWFKNFQRTFLEIIYFSRGLQRNLRQDVNVLVTAISRHFCHLLNIGEGKSCFSLPDDLTVKDYFVNESYLWLYLWHLHEDRQKTKVKPRCNDAYYVSVICFVLVSICCCFFSFECWLSIKNIFSLKGHKRRLQGTRK